MQKHSPALENEVAPGVRIAHIEPLPTRIERNRWKFIGFMVAFTSAISAGAALTVGVAFGLAVPFVMLRLLPASWPQDAPTLLWRTMGAVFAVSLVASWTWALFRISRAEHHVTDRLGARVPKVGALRPTRRVLHDVALAAGIHPAPTLYVIETPRVNAFVIGRSPTRVRVGVTTGMLERIPVDEQRAVFANLLARVLSRDTLWATASSALMGPIWAWRDADLRRDPRMVEAKDHSSAPPVQSQAAQTGEQIYGLMLVVYGLAVFITEVLSWYHREAAWKAAEKADAEGMMLLKDPRSMLSALEHVLERDNFVPSAGDAYSQLFYCWAGFGFAPDDDPEMRRVARLRETLGAEGAAYLPRPNVPAWNNPPVAPRIEYIAETRSDAVNADGSY